ncbi:DUF6377 domain-containing protein [Arachidicoccus ginsenosidivorans]|uniref:Tetratricopeptide repeat protein n=1 Tax=Arachidicoccus ginsenosidivorans TaxID=496057 RepID=A0A5B8VKP2_9BACT|nr:DUF6377 domain-containing protein [Arachidicoccus ginsenosidivorans]QEC71542.1 tetratricopeptide repeat protein [Arachidicoccus ginsenosidivorans]
MRFYRNFICCSIALCFIALLCVPKSARAQSHLRPLFDSLNQTIAAAANYDSIKVREIDSIRISTGSQSALFDKYLKLYSAFRTYNYDSAYSYAQLLLKEARAENNDSLYVLAQLKQGFILVSSGMFKEAFDSLSVLQGANLLPAFRAEYYTLLARCYYDIADFDNDKYHSPAYNALGGRYLDSAMVYYDKARFEYKYYGGLKAIRRGQKQKALKFFNGLMAQKDLTPHQLALTASTLCDLYIHGKDKEEAIYLLLRAAIADIVSSTKETTALFNLSTLLYKRNDIAHASLYIKKAMNDAVFYGAKQRKVQLSSILSLIESQRVANVENQKRNAILYGVIATLLLLLFAGLILIILRQMRKLKKAEKTISKAHLHLQDSNARLEEANKIKEGYLGYFFNGNSEVYAKVEKFKKSIERRVRDGKFSEIAILINQFNLKEDKHELLDNFDRIFLKLFPHFLEQYNALFTPDCQINLGEKASLPTEVRIFALIRLGIHDNEKIASILGYSVHTINTYKTKVKNKSVVSNEQFEQKIMAIKSVQR